MLMVSCCMKEACDAEMLPTYMACQACAPSSYVVFKTNPAAELRTIWHMFLAHSQPFNLVSQAD